MAEEVQDSPSSGVIPKIHDPVTTQNQPIFQSGTYVVQVPKNQIYRVPPPENALQFAQRQSNSEQKKRTVPYCCSCFACIFSIVAIVILVVATLVGISFIFLKPKNPKFQVQRIVFKSSHSQNKTSHAEYDIRLNVHNPSSGSSILYQQDGVASLSFRQQKIATGNFPTFHQDHRNSTDIGLVLKGTSIGLPKDIQNSMESHKSKAHVSLSLKVNVVVRMRTSIFKNGDAEILVACDFTVGALSKVTRILSQECQTNR